MKLIRWLVDGLIEHGIDEKILVEIAVRHAKLGLVPSDYYYPEIYKV